MSQLHTSAAEYTYKGVTFQYTLTGKEATVTAFDRQAAEVCIPAEIKAAGKTFAVTQVATHLNGISYDVTTLEVEYGIQEIADKAFAACRQLRSVTLPATISRVGAKAFPNSRQLQFDLPQTLKRSEKNLRKGIECNVRYPEKKKRTGSIEDLIAIIDTTSHTPKPQPSIPQPPISQPPTPPFSTPLPSPSSPDIDKNVPMGQTKRDNTYVVIVANENYEVAPKVNYAINDGQSFSNYCEKTLGIPKDNIRLYKDATLGQMRRALRRLEEVQKFDPQAQLIFYYSGHGMPTEKDQAAYIVPKDGDTKDLEGTCLSMKKLYDRLGNIKAASVTVLLDACFTGIQRGSSEAILPARGVAVKPKEETLTGNVVVFTAASDNETAMSYDEQHHGLFTYHLLRQLQVTQGNITYGDLFDTVEREVKRRSYTVNDKMQSPTCSTSAALRESWRNMRF